MRLFAVCCCTAHPEHARLGEVCHVALYAEMLEAIGSVDTHLPSLLLTGFPIVGPIQATGRWPAYDKPQKVLPVQHALDRAWEIRAKIVQRVRGTSSHGKFTEALGCDFGRCWRRLLPRSFCL